MNNKGKDIQDRAHRFALATVKLTRKFPRNSEGFTIVGQLIRAVTSIAANLFEGSAAVSRKEFINFVSFAKKSAVETGFWLRFSYDLELIDKLEYEKFSVSATRL